MNKVELTAIGIEAINKSIEDLKKSKRDLELQSESSDIISDKLEQAISTIKESLVTCNNILIKFQNGQVTFLTKSDISGISGRSNNVFILHCTGIKLDRPDDMAFYHADFK